MVQLNSTTMKPPAVSSPEFAQDFAFTFAYGRNNSTNRTAYQTDTAKFWYDEDTGEPAQHYHCCMLQKWQSNHMQSV